MTGNNVLEQLCAPTGASRFLGSHWPDRVFWSHGPMRRLPGALRLPELSSIRELSRRYRGTVSFGNARASSRTVAVENADAETLLRMGLSVYLPDVEATLPPLTDLLRRLETELGVPRGAARAGAFLAPNGNGVTCHFDAEEVLSVQLVGEKRFEIARPDDIEQPWGMQYNAGDRPFDDLYPQVPGGFPDPGRIEFETVDLKPGSILFMPRGTWHRTETRGDSLSVSIIVRTPAALECALEALRLRLLQRPDWRRPLHGAWGDAGQRSAAEAQWSSLIAQLPAIAADLALDDALDTQLSERGLLARMDRRSRFQRRPDARLEIRSRTPQGAVASVWVRDLDGGETSPLDLQIPGPMLPVFDWLGAQRAAFTAGDLAAAHPSLALTQHLKILEALVRGGLLKPLWFRLQESPG